MYAILGGSGFSDRSIFTVNERIEVTTPYGPTSSPVVLGRLGGQDVVFIHRHGFSHQFAPHRVPYRANIWALKQMKVDGIIGVGTAGGIAEPLGPGGIAIVDQLIDYTWGRRVTYFDSPETGVQHVDLTWPFDRTMHAKLVAAAKRLAIPVMRHGVYACTQGPRLRTAAEVRRIARDGGDLIGMTLYPECALARELGVPYAGICVSVNHAAGMGSSQRGIAFARLTEIVNQSVRKVLRVVERMVRAENEVCV